MKDILKYDKNCFFEFEKVAKVIHKDLYIFLYSMCEDNYIVKDAIRNTLIKGYKSFQTFENVEDFKSLMFRIGKLEIKNIEISRSISIAEKVQENHQGELLKKDTKDMIMEAIESLNIDLREIIILKYYYNLSFEKISEIQGIDISTIESNHMSAKWTIKNYLCEAFNI